MNVMKKRIGTKDYNTDTAILVLPDINLFRKSHSFDFFYFDGNTITPIEYDVAKEILIQSGKEEFLYRKPTKDGFVNIGISAPYANQLSEYCRKNNKSLKEVIESIIENLS